MSRRGGEAVAGEPEEGDHMIFVTQAQYEMRCGKPEIAVTKRCTLTTDCVASAAPDYLPGPRHQHQAGGGAALHRAQSGPESEKVCSMVEHKHFYSSGFYYCEQFPVFLLSATFCWSGPRRHCRTRRRRLPFSRAVPPLESRWGRRSTASENLSGRSFSFIAVRTQLCSGEA